MQETILNEEEHGNSGQRPGASAGGSVKESSETEDRAARRARRRARARAQLDTSVPSPCITVCQIDPKDDTCIGCRRHIDEIRDWPILSAEEKRAVLALLPGRKSQ